MDSNKVNDLDKLLPKRLHHGGRLREASHHHGIPVSDWLDLSTGINPHSYPVGAIPIEAWSRLPEEQDGLELAAYRYYSNQTDLNEAKNLSFADYNASMLPIAGSQAAIQALPSIRKQLCKRAINRPQKVLCLMPSYQEHSHSWQQAGFQLIEVEEITDNSVEKADIVVVINPNNPTGKLISIKSLLKWREQLAANGGWLVVDEAFIDSQAQNSLLSFYPLPGLIVLRSVGKFFGLAGARVGFIFADFEIITALNAMLGPWAVAGPGRWAVQHALLDFSWQAQQRSLLAAASTRLSLLLNKVGLKTNGGCELFQWAVHPNAEAVYEALAKQAILTRYFPAYFGLRFGLPSTEDQWERLQSALQKTMFEMNAAFLQF